MGSYIQQAYSVILNV